jgi:hypothetical protein
MPATRRSIATTIPKAPVVHAREPMAPGPRDRSGSGPPSPSIVVPAQKVQSTYDPANATRVRRTTGRHPSVAHDMLAVCVVPTNSIPQPSVLETSPSPVGKRVRELVPLLFPHLAGGWRRCRPRLTQWLGDGGKLWSASPQRRDARPYRLTASDWLRRRPHGGVRT